MTKLVAEETHSLFVFCWNPPKKELVSECSLEDPRFSKKLAAEFGLPIILLARIYLSQS